MDSRKILRLYNNLREWVDDGKPKIEQRALGAMYSVEELTAVRDFIQGELEVKDTPFVGKASQMRNHLEGTLEIVRRLAENKGS